MGRIVLEKQVREAMVQSLTRYLKAELDVEVAGFDAQFLLDFIADNLGPYFYNQGLYDAQAVIRARLELISEDVLAIEKPIRP